MLYPLSYEGGSQKHLNPHRAAREAGSVPTASRLAQDRAGDLRAGVRAAGRAELLAGGFGLKFG